MMNKLHKKYQRLFTKELKYINNSLKKDDLWKGRFYVMQRKCSFYDFPDQSGTVMTIHLRCYDHITNYYKDYVIDYAPYYPTNLWKLHMDIMNTFIVKNLNIWKDCNWHKNKDKIIDCSKLPYIKNDQRVDNWYKDYDSYNKEIKL